MGVSDVERELAAWREAERRMIEIGRGGPGFWDAVTEAEEHRANYEALIRETWTNEGPPEPVTIP